MEYPIGYAFPGLPPDVVREIAQKNPEVYFRLLLLSKRLKATVYPVLKEICNRPVTAKELVSLGKRDYDFETPLFPYNREDSRSILYRRLSLYRSGLSVVYNQLQEGGFSLDRDRFDPSSLQPTIEQLLNQGYEPSIEDIYNILRKRLSCVKLYPGWVINRTIETIRSRYQNILDVLRTYPRGTLTPQVITRIKLKLLRLLFRQSPEFNKEYNLIRTLEGSYLYLLNNFPQLIEELEKTL